MNTFFYKDIAYPDGVIGGKDYYNPVIYSTTERVIGVWTNNKPLYQKTFAFQLTGATSYLDLSPYDVEEIIHEEERAVLDNGLYTLNLPYYENATYSVFTNYIKENMNALAFYAGSGIVSYYSNIIITLQYTKTTDVAGSAPYNNNGVPTVRYSTDEQVIGTWIDGTSVYKKVVVLASPTNITYNSWQDMGVSITGGDKVLSCFGVATDGTNSPLHAYFETGGVVTCQTPRNNSVSYNIEYLIIEYTKTTD